jgi:hypothetical protein
MAMSTNEHQIEDLRLRALESIEGDDPFRRQKVAEILNAEDARQLESFLEEAFA